MSKHTLIGLNGLYELDYPDIETETDLLEKILTRHLMEGKLESLTNSDK